MLLSLKGSPPATDLCCLSADFGRGGEDDAGFDGGGVFLTSPLMFLVLFLRGGALSLPECAPLPLLLRRRWLLLTMRSSVRRSSRLDCDLLLCLRSSAGFRSLLQFLVGRSFWNCIPYFHTTVHTPAGIRRSVSFTVSVGMASRALPSVPSARRHAAHPFQGSHEI